MDFSNMRYMYIHYIYIDFCGLVYLNGNIVISPCQNTAGEAFSCYVIYILTIRGLFHLQ